MKVSKFNDELIEIGGYKYTAKDIAVVICDRKGFEVYMRDDNGKKIHFDENAVKTFNNIAFVLAGMGVPVEKLYGNRLVNVSCIENARFSEEKKTLVFETEKLVFKFTPMSRESAARLQDHIVAYKHYADEASSIG